MAQNPALLDYFETAAVCKLKVFSAENSPRVSHQEVQFVSLHWPRRPWEASLFLGWPQSWCTAPSVTSTPWLSQLCRKKRGDVLTLHCSSELPTGSSHNLRCIDEIVWAIVPTERNRDNISFLPLFFLSIYVRSPSTCKRWCETARQPEFVAMNSTCN